MMNSRTRVSPPRGRGSSRNFVWNWNTRCGSSRYDCAVLRKMSVTASSCVGASTIGRSRRSCKRNSTGPYDWSRPVSCHNSSGWIAGIRISCAPAASISSRMICSTLRIARQAGARNEYTPAESCTMQPARSSSW